MELEYFDSQSDSETISTIWKGLIEEGSYHSFFQGWEWVDCWIKSLAEEGIGVTLVVLFEASIPVCAFFLRPKKYIRKFVIFSSSLSINTTNNTYYDDLYIEYNTPLIRPGYQLDYLAIFESLDSQYQWDEINLPIVERHITEQVNTSLKNKKTFEILHEHRSPAFFVDLKSIRNLKTYYIDSVSKNKKKQIKSSLNAYNKRGEVRIVQALSDSEAISFFEDLIALHQKRWLIKGEKGVFSNNFLLGFHKRLITSNFNTGYIQLLKISCGETPIGFLYNFVYQNRVYFYQSGFNYEAKNKYRPGLISHYSAIIFNLEKGHDIYDFLVGDEAYKKSLSTDSVELHWLKIQKKTWRFQFENNVRKAVKLLTRKKRRR